MKVSTMITIMLIITMITIIMMTVMMVIRMTIMLVMLITTVRMRVISYNNNKVYAAVKYGDDIVTKTILY